MAERLQHGGLHHVGLAFDDLEATARFYAQVLGFEQVERPPSGSGVPGLWFDCGNGQMIHLAQRQDDPSIPVQHLALRVDDIERAISQLEPLGVAVVRRPHVAGFGHQAFVRDPSGNVIELNQPDASSPPAGTLNAEPRVLPGRSRRSPRPPRELSVPEPGEQKLP